MSTPTDPALSYAGVADAYDRARPSYPVEAVEWLVGTEPKTILELGAGTGKMTELLVAAGHRVIAADPLPAMLGKLRARAPQAIAISATAESIPVPSRSIDVVLCAESFHWFDHEQALPEIARVLREEGTLALVWHWRDEGIPWVKKMSRILDSYRGDHDKSNGEGLTQPVTDCEWFGKVESTQFRYWQNLLREELVELVASRSGIAVLPDHQREAVLADIRALYDDYGRGPDGMKLPYLTSCHKVRVTDAPPPPVVMSRVEDDALQLVEHSDVEHSGELTPGATRATIRTQPGWREDTGTLLIDFS